MIATTDQLVSDLQQVSRNAEKNFGRLNAEQLNWKPSEKQWSIAQCFDHLITSNGRYFPQFEQVLKGEKEKTFWESLPLLPSMWGKMLIKSLQPGSGSKYKTSKVFEPATGKLPGTIIRDFSMHNDKLIDFFKKLSALQMDKIKITSPVGDFITYTLSDTLEILTVHEQRHFRQAENVMKTEGFPK